MSASVYDTAQLLYPGLSTQEAAALQTLCDAAWDAVGAQQGPCDSALLCGAAYLALSWLVQPQAQSFTAGAVSVTAPDRQARASLYAALARQLLAPYIGANDFAFLGVEA